MTRRITPATVPPEDRARVVMEACSRLRTEEPPTVRLLSIRDRRARRTSALQMLQSGVLPRDEAERVLRELDEMPFIVEGVL